MDVLWVLYIISFVFGEFTIISATLDGKNYSNLKSLFIGLYLLIGINFPIAVNTLLTIKLNTQIPILSLCMTFYEWGICLIGLTAISYHIYKVIKDDFINVIKRRKQHEGN